MGGIFIELLKDVRSLLAPLEKEEVLREMRQLKSYKMIEGVRGQRGINRDAFADIIIRLSALATTAPEIIEMDLNPLLGTADTVTAVDARIRVVKR